MLKKWDRRDPASMRMRFEGGDRIIHILFFSLLFPLPFQVQVAQAFRSRNEAGNEMKWNKHKRQILDSSTEKTRGYWHWYWYLNSHHQPSQRYLPRIPSCLAIDFSPNSFFRRAMSRVEQVYVYMYPRLFRAVRKQKQEQMIPSETSTC